MLDNKGKAPLDYAPKSQRQILLETKPETVSIAEEESEVVTQSLIDNQLEWGNEYLKYMNCITVPVKDKEKGRFYTVRRIICCFFLYIRDLI